MSSPTDQQLLDAYRNALNALALTGQSYVINGRTVTRANLPEIRQTITWLEQRIAAADTSVDESGTGILLVRF